MKLNKLLKDIPVTQIKGSKDLDITGVCANSKLVAPGNLFIARKGKAKDGSFFIPEAVAAGAVAVVSDIYDPLLSKHVTQVIHPDITILEGLIAANYYRFASQELFMVGITGTNGKTTTSFLVKHILDNIDGACGLIGTIEYITGQHRYQATRTTPDAASTQKMLREMVLQGCRSAVMEVTSHALDQNRVDQIDFDTAVFTNLTLDHLDYHQSMENYAEAKHKLFLRLDPSKHKKANPFGKTAIVNADSNWHKRMLEGCKARIITFAIDSDADLKAENIELSSSGTTLVLNYRGQKARLDWPLVGRYNIYNCLAATAVGLSRQLPLDSIAKTLASVPAVPGRLEVIPNPLGLKIYVDFAHTDDALKNILECLNEFKKDASSSSSAAAATGMPANGQEWPKFVNLMPISSSSQAIIRAMKIPPTSPARSSPAFPPHPTIAAVRAQAIWLNSTARPPSKRLSTWPLPTMSSSSPARVMKHTRSLPTRR